jgi:hypothetical protein
VSDTPTERPSVPVVGGAFSLIGVNETLGRTEVAVSRNVRGQIALFSGHVLWQVVGVAVGAIGYAAEAGGFELEMRRAASRSQR